MKRRRNECANKKNGNPFYWSQTEALEELEKLERMEKIKQKWAEDRLKARKNPEKKTLVHILGGLEDEEEEREGCLICSL